MIVEMLMYKHTKLYNYCKKFLQKNKLIIKLELILFYHLCPIKLLETASPLNLLFL